MTRRAPPPAPFMPGELVELEVLGRLTTGRVSSVDRDPVTLEWTYVVVFGETGGTYRRKPEDLRLLPRPRAGA